MVDHPRKRIDLTGRKFHRLTAIKDAGILYGSHRLWECKCECGETAFVPTGHLTGGQTLSCGCLKRELVNNRRLLRAHAPKPTKLTQGRMISSTFIDE